MWTELETSEKFSQPATWTQAAQNAVSGLIICGLILGLFAFAG